MPGHRFDHRTVCTVRVQCSRSGVVSCSARLRPHNLLDDHRLTVSRRLRTRSDTDADSRCYCRSSCGQADTGSCCNCNLLQPGTRRCCSNRSCSSQVPREQLHMCLSGRQWQWDPGSSEKLQIQQPQENRRQTGVFGVFSFQSCRLVYCVGFPVHLHVLFCRGGQKT